MLGLHGVEGGYVSKQRLYSSAGNDYGAGSGNGYGIRPVVMLDSSIQLIDTNTVKNECKVYDIKTKQQCLIEGTKVLTEKGMKNIEDISIGDKVYSMNTQNNQKELRKVNAVYRGETSETYKIMIGNEEIQTTARHKFYTADRGWIVASSLEVGEEIIDKDSNKLKITKIEQKRYEKPVKIYDLTVEEYHNYFITESAILVHNKAWAS